MGLYDCVYCYGPPFVCSEGHLLDGHEFQTYDLGRTMGEWTLSDRLYGAPGIQSQYPFTGLLALVTACSICPVYWDPTTGNIMDLLVDFEVHLAADVVGDVRRISPAFREWVRTLDARMRGPMTYDEALKLQRQRRECP
jgi:hypothetical protein